MGKEEDEGKWSSCNWHRQRHVIVLASLGGVLAATVVVITTSVVLRPPHLGFTVDRATVVRSNDDNHHPVRLELTVKILKTTTTGSNVAAKVRYEGVLIYLQEATSYVNATTTTAPDFHLPGGEKKLFQIHKKLPTNWRAELIINAESQLFRSHLNTVADNAVNGVGVTVIMKALVSFKIGLVNTGLYYITLSNSGVVFKDT